MNRSAVVAGFASLVLLTALIGHAQETKSERAARIAAMSDAEKLALRNKLERFDRLPADERQRLFNLNAQLEERSDGEELRQVMHRYYDWLKTLNSGQRLELQELPIQERIVKIKELMAEEERSRFFNIMKDIMKGVKAEEFDAIHKWIIDEWLVREKERVLASEDELYRHKHWLREGLSDPSLSENRKVYILWFNMFGVEGIRDVMPNESDFAELKSRLDAETQKKLDAEPDRQQDLLAALMRATVFSQFRNHVDDDKLKEFYAQLPEKEKARFAGYSPERFDYELRKLYRQENGKRFAGNRPPGPPPGLRGDGRGRGGDGRGDGGRGQGPDHRGDQDRGSRGGPDRRGRDGGPGNGGPGMRGERGPRPPMPAEETAPPKPEEEPVTSDTND